MKKLLLFGAAVLLTVSASAQVELLTNGGFESGDLSSWTVSAVNGVDNGPGSCVENWRVETNSAGICGFVTDFGAAEGTFAAFTSFDSDVADTQWILEQMVSIPATVVAADFSFNFQAEFDFSLGSPITIPRELRIDIYRMDGTPFSNFWLDDFSGAGLVSESYSETVDVSGLLSGLEGMDAMIRITATIPEITTGPGKAMIDAVSFIVDDGLSVEDQTLATAITIAPNPSNGAFSINYSGQEVLTQAAIYDVSGKQVAQYNISNLQGSSQINTNLPTGFYILTVQSETSQISKKLIIQ